MIKQFARREEVIKLLKEGWEIYTERGCAPYRPLYFRIYSDNESKPIHHSTIKSLINNKIIRDTSVLFKTLGHN